MLVMSRRQGETILIGDKIEIVIAHIGRSRVKVGIRAPRELPVVAREVQLVSEENRAAAGASPERLNGLLARLQPGSAAETDCKPTPGSRDVVAHRP
ncbi:MAG: carbon storage regulator [Acidobacteriota bacterium]|nr:carbon storage regulator [Acidobacteriota bacterium]